MSRISGDAALLPRRRFLRGLVLTAAILFNPALLAAASDTPAKPIVLAYVFPQDAALLPGAIDPAKVTRINYAFANLRDGRIVNGFPTDEQNFATLLALKRQNSALMVLVSVGGWSWSGGFSNMALTGKTRGIFIDSVMDYLTRYRLDGLDIDWEYPGMTGAGHTFRSQDKQNFTLLLKELRGRMDGEEKALHRPLLLTIAAGASDEYLSHTEMSRISAYVDTINLMAYDFYEPSSDKTTGHHAPLFLNPDDPKAISVDQSVHQFLKAGVPASKLVLGVPFYGHAWRDVAAGPNHGLFERGKAAPDAYANYSAISGTLLQQGFVRYWDPLASAPYLYNSATRTFVSYDDPESLALKCRYVLDHHLAGVMFWDYGSDSTGALLNSIDRSFHLDASSQR